MSRAPLALAFSLLIAGSMVGCASVAEPSPVSPTAAAPAPVTNAPAAQPANGAIGIDAASQMLILRWQLMAAGDWAGACSLLSPGSIEDLIAVADPTAADCVAALTSAAAVASEALATAEAEGYLPLVPYYYVPTSIEISAAGLEEDSPTLVYASNAAVVSTDPREFSEGVGAVPGWLTESTYIQQDSAGIWLFITAAERE